MLPGVARIGTWLALLALYGQVLAGFAPPTPAWARPADAICHAGSVPGAIPGGAQGVVQAGRDAPAPLRQGDQHCPPCAFCAGVAAPLPLLSEAPQPPAPRATDVSAVLPSARGGTGPARLRLPPARGPPLA